MRKLTLSLIASAAAIAAGGVAYAQPTPGPGPAHDLSRAEVEQRTAQAFDRLDANKDGKLDKSDREAREKSRFDRIDTNHDGSVSYAEFTAMRGKLDGVRKERMAERGEAHERFGRHGDHHRMAMRGFAGRGEMARLADANSDRSITKAEFQAAALQRFDKLDTNKDGTVSAAEAKAARDAMRQQWRTRREARDS